MPISPISRLAYTLDEAIAASGVSRSTFYRVEKRGLIKLIRGFGRVKISAADLHRLLGLEAQP